jgi:GNAT superfamily N-acetyltransferase
VGGLAVRPPAGVELRPAARDDLREVVRLLGDRENVPSPAEDSAEVVQRWERLLSSVDASPFLAFADGSAVGLQILIFRRRLNFATWEGWVPELIVQPQERRRGIGRALLRVAIEEWRLRGAHRLSVDLAPGEDAGAALVASLGLQDTFLRFRQEPIDPHEGDSPPGVEIRPLQAGDFDAVTWLVAEMGPHRSPVPERMAAVERTFRELVDRPSMAWLVAVGDGMTVGACTLEVRDTLRTSAPEGWIPELVVTEPHRGRGIGRALLSAALSTARDRGAGAVVLESGPKRQTAQALYGSFGFRHAGAVATLLRDRE